MGDQFATVDADHFSSFATEQPGGGEGTKSQCQDAVKGRGAAAALHMAEHGVSGFEARVLSDVFLDVRCACGALRNDDDRTSLASLAHVAETVTDFLKAIR